MAVTSNSDLSLNNGIPGVYVKLDLTGAGSSVDNTLKRLLLLGTRASTGTIGPDTPTLTTSQTDANSYFGRGSDLARLYAAASSQVGVGALEIWCCGINEPSGGVASRYELVVDFSTGSTAAAPGAITVWLAGYELTVAVATGDSPATIATNIKNAIDLMLDIPISAATATQLVTGDTVRMTYDHKGAHGEDFPIRVKITGSSNVVLSPGADPSNAGTLKFATSSAAAGSCVLNVGGTTITSSIAGIETATTIATNLTTAVNAGSYPVYATNPSAGVVKLFYRDDRDVRRVQCRVIKTDGTANDTTVNAVTAGSYAYVGTASGTAPGSGTPTLTTALTNIAALPAFGAWATCFGDSTSLGTMASHIATYADGYYQKGQVLFFGSAAKLATAGAIPAATSPALTASPRAVEGWCLDNPQQAWEDGARCAAEYLTEDYLAQNFAGKKLVSRSTTVPRLIPHVAARPSQDDQNTSMMTYYMTPLVVTDTNELAILRDVTTSNNADVKQKPWSFIKQLDGGRIALRAWLLKYFQGKSYKASGDPKTPNTFTAQSVVDSIYVFLSNLDDQGLFDGAAAVKDAIRCEQNPSVPTRLDIFVPWAVIQPIYQLAAVVSPQ